MVHIVLKGWIKSENKDFIEELEKFINEKNEIVGSFDYYEVEDLNDGED